MSVTIKLDTKALDRLILQIPGDTAKVIEEAARIVEAQTKKNIRAWPLIDTGALLNSIQAEKKRGTLWAVHDGVEYGVYWELGHKNIFLRRYVRKPFMGPAIQYTAAKLEQMLAQGLFHERL